MTRACCISLRAVAWTVTKNQVRQCSEHMFNLIWFKLPALVEKHCFECSVDEATIIDNVIVGSACSLDEHRLLGNQ